MKTLLFSALTLTSLLAQAHSHDYYEIGRRYKFHGHADCVVEYVTKLRESTRLTKACAVVTPLKLSWITQSYPGLRDNPRRVEYWDGMVEKTVATDNTYLRELVDDCHGKIISSQTLVETEQTPLDFHVQNINLDPSITESYMLVPMTIDEARQELQAAKGRCEVSK